jgi:polyphenol oxidase
MIEQLIKRTPYFAFNKLIKYKNLIHFVSTRGSGDMAFNESKPGEYIENRKRFLALFGINLENTIFCEQVHKDKVEIVDEKFLINRPPKLNIVFDADAVITRSPKICMVIRTSDCVPLILYDPKNNVLGVTHAGWRGTYVEIAKRTVEKMAKEFMVNPADLIVGIGPSLGPDHFFIRKDVKIKFEEKGWENYLNYQSKDQWLLDIWAINKKQLVDSGVKEKNIEDSGISTFSSDLFYSYRKKDPEGHFITGAMLTS